MDRPVSFLQDSKAYCQDGTRLPGIMPNLFYIRPEPVLPDWPLVQVVEKISFTRQISEPRKLMYGIQHSLVYICLSKILPCRMNILPIIFRPSVTHYLSCMG